MENHHFNGKIHYFYGHFQLPTVSSPEGYFWASAIVPSPCCVDLTMLYDGSYAKWWWFFVKYINSNVVSNADWDFKQVSTIMHVGFRNMFGWLHHLRNSFLVGVGGYCWLSGLRVGFPSCGVGGWTVSGVNAISIFLYVFFNFRCFSLCFLYVSYFALCCSMLLCHPKINYKINLLFLFISSLCFSRFLYFSCLFLYLGLSENRVYSNYSHLIGIMIINHWV